MRYNKFIVTLLSLATVPSSYAGITQTNSVSGEVSTTGRIHIDSIVNVWGASYDSDSGKDFNIQIGDTTGANDRIWLNYAATTLFAGKVLNGSDRSDTFLFPIARYQMCVETNNKAGAYIKVIANRFQEQGGDKTIPVYIEINANGNASSGAQSFLFTSDQQSDIDNLTSKTIYRYRDTQLNSDGSINHSINMKASDWTNSGHNNIDYSNFSIGAGAYVALDHYTSNSSATSYSLARNQTVASDNVSFKYDSTEFADSDACPVSARIDTYIYIDLAALLIAPGASYSGSINIDLSTTDT